VVLSFAYCLRVCTTTSRRHCCEPMRPIKPRPCGARSAPLRNSSIYIYIIWRMNRSRLRMDRSEYIILPANSTSVENQFCRPESMGRQNGRGHMYLHLHTRAVRAVSRPARGRSNNMEPELHVGNKRRLLPLPVDRVLRHGRNMSRYLDSQMRTQQG
jgi:hypothetical protein